MQGAIASELHEQLGGWWSILLTRLNGSMVYRNQTSIIIRMLRHPAAPFILAFLTVENLTGIETVGLLPGLAFFTWKSVRGLGVSIFWNSKFPKHSPIADGMPRVRMAQGGTRVH
jgi:hypothetical protein